ncbi:MAG TPA: LemA family protein [Ideonella sp.]|uniref:LemA family protein n=1 Tax=Ideonella sp. TaxID=1929293 RepID=UPI002E35F6A0|nr:LemA family protein [Ideonella sp.]HEX5684848.1 LemA family protein [Ideonella sp.]
MEAGSDWAGWGPLLLKVGAAAVLLFWIVGAYNRLVRLRGAIGGAWAQIDELLARRSFLLEALADAVRGPLADEGMTLATLGQADQRQRSAALSVRARPSHSPALVAWVLAEAELASPMARLQALIEQRPELAGSEPVLPLQRQLLELAPRLIYARQLFSDAAEAYNAALEEFPTRAVGRLFGMRAASRL